MYSIRQGLFETNSSSSHMLCISNNLFAMKIPAQVKISDLKKTGWVQEETNETDFPVAYKPNIYLYPEEETTVDVYLTANNLLASWPYANAVDGNQYYACIYHG